MLEKLSTEKNKLFWKNNVSFTLIFNSIKFTDARITQVVEFTYNIFPFYRLPFSRFSVNVMRDNNNNNYKFSELI